METEEGGGRGESGEVCDLNGGEENGMTWADECLGGLGAAW